MSIQAKHLESGQFIYDENDKQVYKIIEKKSHKSDVHQEHLTVQNFNTNHKTNKSYSLDHHVRLLEPTYTTYTLSHLLDNPNGSNQFMSVYDSNATVREDLYVSDPNIIKQLQSIKLEDNTVTLNVTKIEVDTLHRTDNTIVIEKVTDISGVDMKHLYDKHHKEHHKEHHKN